MIKLIASDIDGTLMPYGRTELDPRLFPLIHRLREQGVLFCPASGRQFHSLRRLFAPIANEIAFLCENGAILYGAGTEEDAPVLSKTVMEQEKALALCHDILALPEGAHIVISGANTSYLMTADAPFREQLVAVTGNATALVDRPEDVPEEILKVSLYRHSGAEPDADLLGPRWAEQFRMTLAGPGWLDFMSADKGDGIRGICAALGLTPDEVVAFGDHYNDVPMLEAVGIPYMMEGSDDYLKGRFPRHCSNVEDTLEEILAGLEKKA
ncbi:HAD family hydrolase [Flavonifractor sp. An92]|uniref:HAD family hydrolase n=1 Tax=Flavonifractor sp. An92 TaxID=1965666 RepID=UPI000B39454E|nr:HAD family hydrolase [Flavonifractor sp. An92]OUN05596.1 HAD family hydrolase [Flavonifractor sp. An92]